MDKIDINSYLSDYTIDDETAATVSNYSVTEYLYIFSPSPQLLNWYVSRGWIAVSWSLTDPSAITDYAYIQKNQFDEERVLQVLVDRFTSAYNEGRTLNDTRYDEILALLAAIMDKTEDELNSIEDDEDTFESAVDSIISNLIYEQSTHSDDVDGHLDDWGDAADTKIDNDFTAVDSRVQQTMIDTGWYNTSNWTTAQAGIAREKSEANTIQNDLKTQRQLELKKYQYETQENIRMKFIEARNRLINIQHTQGSLRTEIRNRIGDIIAKFAESRTDDYPSFLEPLNAMYNVAISQRSQGWS